MKTKPVRHSSQHDFARRFELTFGRIGLPRPGRKSLLALGMAGVLITGAASADWYVYDQRVESVLQEIRDRIGEKDPDTVTGHLDKLNNRFDVKGETYDPDKDDETKTKVAEAPDLESKDKAKSMRCGGEKTPAAQKTVCEAVVKLEEDRYKYLQDMKKISEKRAQDLKAITDERRNIGEDEYGKLESNTNRLLALIAHQRIDDLNLQMAMTTFDERLRERREQLNYEGAVAINPRNKTASGGLPGGGGIDIGGLFNGAAQVATLEAALQVARQRDR